MTKYIYQQFLRLEPLEPFFQEAFDHQFSASSSVGLALTRRVLL
jgi:hypothetical protein